MINLIELLWCEAVKSGGADMSSSHTFTLWYCSAENFSVQMGATGTYPRSSDECCIRKGREYIPLRDGLITTTGVRLSCSHTSFRKPAGASSPTAAGAWADLDRPSPDRRIKSRLMEVWETRPGSSFEMVWGEECVYSHGYSNSIFQQEI